MIIVALLQPGVNQTTGVTTAEYSSLSSCLVAQQKIEVKTSNAVIAECTKK